MAVTTLAERIAALKARLDALRPLDAAALAQLEAAYDVDLTFTSNALEGNTLTLQETALVIEKGITVAGKPLVSHNEAIDHYEAVRAMRGMAARDRAVNEADILELHAIVTRRSNLASGGRYAQTSRRIAGARVVLPSAAKIPALMRAFSATLAATHGWEQAFEAHYALVSIHPFADGNGRTARLLMNLLLLRDGYPPVPIGPEKRARYLAVLEGRQLAEPLGHEIEHRPSRDVYRAFMAECLAAALEDYLAFLAPEGT